MKPINYLLIGLLSILTNCSQPYQEPQNINPPQIITSMSDNHLLENVRLAINPQFQDWVLFENGTYIIFDNADSISDIKAEAIKLMQEFGPVHTGGPAGDFSVTHLDKTNGWVVSGHGYGMYTYVHPTELDSSSPNDIEIGLYGRAKRNDDGQNPKIIHINKKA